MRVFVTDTMTFMEYVSIETIPWNKMTIHPDKILIPPIVIRQLNRNKDNTDSSRRRERASKGIKQIRDLFVASNVAKISGSIAVEPYPSEPSIDYAALKLDDDIEDDVILATAIEYKADNPDDEIFLLTDDIGLTIKARYHSIPVTGIPQKYRLPDTPTETENENAKLRAQLADATKRDPKLEVTMSANGSNQLAPPEFLNEDELFEEMYRSAIKDKPDNVVETLSQRYSSRYDTWNLDVVDIDRIASAYILAVREFMEELQQYVHRNYRPLYVLRTGLWFKLKVSNIGRGEADGTIIDLAVPPSVNADLVTGKPEVSERAPEPPDLDQVMSEHRSRKAGHPISGRLRTHVNGSSIPQVAREITLHCGDIRHGYDTTKEIGVLFSSPADVKPFQIEYSASAKSLPASQGGKLLVDCRKRGD